MNDNTLELRGVIDQLFTMIEETAALAQSTAQAQDTRFTAIMPGEAMQILNEDEEVVGLISGSNPSGQLIEPIAGPEPKKPEAPEVTAAAGVINVITDGDDVDGEPAQANHKQVIIHAWQDSTITPYEGTVYSAFPGPDGHYGIAVDAGLWFIAIQWETNSGQLSEISDVVEIEVEDLVNVTQFETALAEAQALLDTAKAEFEAGNQERKDELENLNNVVLPALQQSLTQALEAAEDRVEDLETWRATTATDLQDARTRLAEAETALSNKVDPSQLTSLDQTLRDAFGEDLSTAIAQAKIDAAADATAKADAAQQAAEATAEALAVAQADAAKSAAIAAAAADALAKANAARDAAIDSAATDAEAKASAAQQAAEAAAAADAKAKADQAKADAIATAAADAQSKANAAKADAEAAAKAYADQQGVILKGEAAADAQEKADAVLAQANDLMARAITQGQNLIVDGSFEEGDTNWSTSANQFTASVGNEARTGSRVMVLDISSGNRWPRTSSFVPIEEGRTYRLSAWFKVVTGTSGNIGFVPRLHHAGGTSSPVVGSISGPTVEDGWTRHTFDWTCNYDGAYQVQFAPWAGSQADSILWVDDFTAYDITEAKAALDAANAAQARADEAHTNAGTAWTHADAAMTRAGDAEAAAKTHADNLPKVLHGTTAPSGTAPNGSIWWQHSGSLQGNVTAQWNRVNGQWVSTPIDSEAIANLDVGKLTAGSAELATGVVNKLYAGVVEAKKADVINLVAQDLIANNATLINAAMRNLSVTERAQFVAAFAQQLYADEFTARVAQMARAIVAAPNLWPDPNFENPGGLEARWELVNNGLELNGNGRQQGTYALGLPVPMLAGEQHVFEADVTYLEGTVGDTTLYVRHYRKDGGFNVVRLDRRNSTGKLSATYTAGADTDYLAVGFFVESNMPAETRVRIDNFVIRRMTDGNLLVENSVGTRELNAVEVFADTATINKIWTDVVRAKLLTAEEAIIGGALLKDDSVTVNKLVGLESIMTALLQAKKISAGDIEANAISAAHIDANAVRGGHIEAGSLTADHIDAENFTLASQGESTRTELSARGMEVVQGWSGYPDPGLEDPELTQRRRVEHSSSGLTLWTLTNAQGQRLHPSLQRFDIYARVRVNSLDGLQITAYTRNAPDDLGSYPTGQWSQSSTGEKLLRLTSSTPGSLPYFGWIALAGDVDMLEMWLEPHDSNLYSTLSVTKDGLQAWDETGSQTASIGGAGRNFLAGRLATSALGQPGVILTEDQGLGSVWGAGVWLTANGSAGDGHAAIWATKDPESGDYTALNVRAPSGGDLRFRGVAGFDSMVDFQRGMVVRGSPTEILMYANPGEGVAFGKPVAIADALSVTGNTMLRAYTRIYGNLRVDGTVTAYDDAQFNENIRVEGWIRNPGRPTRTSGANVFMGGTGEYLWKNTSVRRSKVNIETIPDIAHRLLDLEPHIWLDRTDIEMRSQECADLIEDTPDGPKVDEAKLAGHFEGGELPRRVPGLVAEEVEAAGLSDYAMYETDEETGEERLQSVAYDRLWTLLIPLVREHRDRIETLESENTALQDRVDDLEARLTQLEELMS